MKKSIHRLKNSEVRELNENIKSCFCIESQIDKRDIVELFNEEIVVVNNEALFFYREGILVPTLKALLKNNFLKKITVDMGAVKFVVKGADIMRPGIVAVDDNIKKDEIISIVDVNNKRPLAIGKALYNTDEIRAMDKGIAVKNLHYAGDIVWNFS